MSKLYSPSEAAFFDSSVHSVIPKDAIRISDVLYETLLKGRSVGQIIVLDGSGMPALSDPAPASLDELKAAKLAELETACATEIAAGFTSDALGEVYTYPAKPTDQSNLQASVLASILPGVDEKWTTPFWCADAQGKWAYQAHTVTQIQQVGVDGKNAINAAIAQKIVLEQQVVAAKTAAEVATITWPKE
jgi:hypothetical protein